MNTARGLRRSLSGVFAVPLALALATIVGLVIGLTGEGVRDLLSWLLLTPPIGAIAWAWRGRT